MTVTSESGGIHATTTNGHLGSHDSPRLPARRSRACLAALLLSLLCTQHLRAQQEPTLDALPREEQTSTAMPLVPLRIPETSWWIEVRAESQHAPLSHIEYSARFRDERPQPLAGSLTLSGTTRTAAGRINVRCSSETDYQRPFAVRLRVHAGDGHSSTWVEVRFPPPSRDGPPSEGVGGIRSAEDVAFPIVTVDVGDDKTVGDVRRSLKEQAQQLGAQRIRNLRVVRSSEERVVFAADAVVPTPPTPTAVPLQPPAAATEVLGEISIPRDRR